MTHDERRKSPRTDYDCAVLIDHGGSGFIGHIEDVSATGCRVSRPEDWSLADGALVRLFLLVDMRHAVSADARVVWSSDDWVGFEYSQPQSLPA